MPIYEYVCAKKHRTTRIVSVTEFAEQIACSKCKQSRRKEQLAKLVVSQTAPPKFKRGVGGFHAPTD
jgi:putative FmdB family regulatory protein